MPKKMWNTNRKVTLSSAHSQTGLPYSAIFPHIYAYHYSFLFWQQMPEKQSSTVEPRFMNTSHHEKIGSRTNFPPQKKSQVTNSVLSNEQASQQQRLATSLKYLRESISYCVTFAQYT
jgi:hypothetical protein